MPTTRPLTEQERVEFERLVAAAEAAPAPPPAQTKVDPEFLNRSVEQIIPDLKAMSEADLVAVKQAETKGKTRKSMLAAIDAELEAR